MSDLVIRPLESLNADELRSLLDESLSEGFRFVQTLLDYYESGANCFDVPGSILLGVYAGDRLIGIGGIQPDPYLNRSEVGRVRHVYVLHESRRQGVGRVLLDALINRAAERFDLLALRTPTLAAAAFYEALGFDRETIISQATHSLMLKPKDS